MKNSILFPRTPISLDDVEIIVLTYNRSAMLREQLLSLVNQTVEVARISVIDNGSTDDTALVVKNFSREYPFVCYRPTEVHYSNNVRTLEFSQKIAAAKYVAVFHDDDIVHPQFMEYALRAINSYDDVVIVSGDMEKTYNPTGNDMKVQLFRPLVWRGGDAVVNQLIYQRLSFPCCVYRTDVYKAVRFDSEKYGKICDHPFLFEVSSKGTSVFLRGSFIRYRIHRGSGTNNAADPITAENVLNVIRSAKELLSAEKLSVRVVAPYILHKLAHNLIIWASGTIHCDTLRLLCDGGVISGRACKLLENRIYRRCIKHIVKWMKKRISRGK